MAKHFMVYIPAATDGEEAAEESLNHLKKQFGEDSVYKLNGRGNFVISVPLNIDFLSVMDKVGFSEETGKTGLLVEFNNTNINGWYPRSLWSFIEKGMKGESAAR